jgi:hypothetical protein
MLCAWSGIAFAAMTLTGLFLLARFVPPPSPALGTGEVVALYQQNANGIRSGMVLMMFGAALFIPFTALITQFIIRIEGRVGVVSIMQIMGGFTNVLLFFYPCLWWLTASFRLDRNPELIVMLHDAAWLQYLGALAPFLFMLGSVAIAAFVDDCEKPAFPRWVGFFNLFAILAFLPDQMIFFFHSGPFAWSGLFGWWIPLFDFFGWIVVMFVVLRKAVMDEAM